MKTIVMTSIGSLVLLMLGCSDPSKADSDGDGATVAVDCDDGDASVGSVLEDADCDGTVAAEDCDDESAFVFTTIGGECVYDGTCVDIQAYDDQLPSGTYRISLDGGLGAAGGRRAARPFLSLAPRLRPDHQHRRVEERVVWWRALVD